MSESNTTLRKSGCDNTVNKKNLGSQGTKYGGKSKMIQTSSNTRTLCAIFLMRAAQEKKGRSCLKTNFPKLKQFCKAIVRFIASID